LDHHLFLKISKNPNNLYLDLLFKPLVKHLEILKYNLNFFLGYNYTVKPLTLTPLPGAFGGFITIVLPECTLSPSRNTLIWFTTRCSLS